MKKILPVLFVVIIVALVVSYYVTSNKKDNTAEKVSEEVPVSTVAPVEEKVLEQATIVAHAANQEIDFFVNYAIDKGFLKKQGVDLEFIKAPKAPYLLVEAGEADVQFGGLARPIGSYLSNLESRVIVNMFENFDVFAVSKYDKDNIDQIKKVAAFSAKGERYHTAVAALKNLGADIENIEFVTTGGNEASFALLESGNADFALLSNYENFIKSEASSEYTVFGPEITRGDIIFLRSVITNKKNIDEKPEKIQKIVSGFYEAVESMKQNKAEVVEFIIKKYEYDEKGANNFYNNFVAATNRVSFVPELNAITPLAQEEKAEAENPERDLNGFIYAEFAKNAMAQ